MKILFLCGSIEPGQDGVGDYTRRLAAELSTKGQYIKVIALYDRDAITYKQEEQTLENIEIPVIRLPQSMADKERYSLLKKFIDQFKPDLISLQFVIFSFHKKGLPLSLTNKMVPLLRGYSVHLMFHELWVGLESHSTWKHKVLGFFQRRIIKHFLKNIQPFYIHTHTPLYAWQLKNIGFDSSILPLFGNVPVFAMDREYNNNSIKAIVFGSIHYGAPVELFASEFYRYLKGEQKTAEIIFVGRCGAEQENWILAFEKERINVRVLGEQMVEQISYELLSADFGITSTPFLLTGKSGTVAAMLEHELPVICVAREWTVDGFELNSSMNNGIVNYQKGNLFDFFNNVKVKNTQNIHSIARQFIQSLSSK
jgi:hypothetical protein